jgi:Meiotically up-regulated gene 113
MTVYIIGGDRDRLVKIGYSCNVRQRLWVLRSERRRSDLKILWESDPDLGAIDEGKLHAVFDLYRKHGEWFDFGDADPVALVAAAIRLPNMKLPARPVRRPGNRKLLKRADLRGHEPESWLDEQGRKCYINDGRTVVIVPSGEWDRLPYPDEMEEWKDLCSKIYSGEITYDMAMAMEQRGEFT